MKKMKRMYTADENGRCGNCGKEASIPSSNNKTVVFEGCSIKEIIAELKRFSAATGVIYCEVAKITYEISEE